jgi:hypothetical protein
VLLGVIIYLLKNPEKVDQWNHIITKLFEWRRQKREKQLISTSLDYRITSVARKINSEAEGILPFGIRIKWKNPDEVSSYVKQGNVVVVLKKHDDLDRNIIEACMAYVPQGLLPKSRNSIDKEVLESIDHYVVRKILSDGNYTSAYNYFVRTVLDEKLTSDTEFYKWFEDMSRIDAIGFFTRVLLEEFRRLGDQLYGTLEEENYRKETKDFVEFLRKFYLRTPGDDTTKLAFLGEKIHIGIVLISKKKTWDIAGTDAYIKRIDKYRSLGVSRIFLFSYAHEKDSSIVDSEGFVISVRKERDFGQMIGVEKKCRSIDYLHMLRSQRFVSRVVSGKKRLARYCLFEVTK